MKSLLCFQEFSEELITKLVETLPIPDTCAMALLSLSAIVKEKNNELMRHDDAIITAMKRTPIMSYNGAQVLIHLVTVGDKVSAMRSVCFGYHHNNICLF